jgi:adenine deaminase
LLWLRETANIRESLPAWYKKSRDERSTVVLDLVIKNGLIVDGSGAPAFSGEVTIWQGKIACVAGEVVLKENQHTGPCQDRL